MLLGDLTEMETVEPNSSVNDSGYFTNLSKRLSKDGFQIVNVTSIGSYKIDIYAGMSRLEANKFGEITRFIVGASFDSVNSSVFFDFSSAVMTYCLEH